MRYNVEKNTEVIGVMREHFSKEDTRQQAQVRHELYEIFFQFNEDALKAWVQ